MMLVKNLKPSSGRVFNILVVTPVIPGALLFFILLIMALISFVFRVIPSASWLEVFGPVHQLW